MKAEKTVTKIEILTVYRLFVKYEILTSNVYEPVALTVKLTALIMMKKCCWWLNRQLIAKAEILAMKFSKNCGTSSYLKVDAVGSAGYEPRVLTAELMARILQSTEEPKGARRWIVDESGNRLEKKRIICVESLLCEERNPNIQCLWAAGFNR